MIKGKAKMEFGTGDIRMTGALSGGIGALCCITQEPHEIALFCTSFLPGIQCKTLG